VFTTRPTLQTGCDLSYTTFTDASLRNADLTGSTLTGADLRGADLAGATGITVSPGLTCSS
jgi:uncharacterized protein YjbI with pentapeptide repeats